MCKVLVVSASRDRAFRALVFNLKGLQVSSSLRPILGRYQGL